MTNDELISKMLYGQDFRPALDAAVVCIRDALKDGQVTLAEWTDVGRYVLLAAISGFQLYQEDRGEFREELLYCLNLWGPELLKDLDIPRVPKFLEPIIFNLVIQVANDVIEALIPNAPKVGGGE